MHYEMLPPDYKKTFSRYTGLLKLIGVDIFSSGGSNAMARIFAFNILFLPFVYSQLEMIANITAENFLEGAQVVSVALIFVLDVIKMTTALVKKSEIKQILLEIGELWPRGLKDGDEKAAIMKTWLRRMGTLLNAYYIYAVVNIMIVEVKPVLMTCYNFYTGAHEYVFPLVIERLKVNSTMSYVALYVWEVAATAQSQLCLYLSYDLLMMTVISDVSILFRLLQVDMENSIQTRVEGNLSVSDPESYERILRIVKDHQKLLRIARQLSDIFGLVIFFHIMFSAILICCFGFLAVVFSGVAGTISNLLIVWTVVICIFLLSLSGQLLYDTSSGVADAAYRASWYESDVKVKKLVLIIIIRSQRPCYLSALGFFDMTLRSFSKVMSTSWTYFSLLVQMYKDK